MGMSHLEVNQSCFTVSGGKVIVAATHREVCTSKPTWFLHGCWCERGGKSELSNSLLTSKSTNLEDFFKNFQR
jgi:hypothetical protein